MSNNTTSSINPALDAENQLSEIYISKLMHYGNLNRSEVVKSIANELLARDITYNELDIEHVKYVNQFLKKMIFTFIEITINKNGSSDFSIRSINIAQFLLSDINGTLEMIEGEIPPDLAQLLRILS